MLIKPWNESHISIETCDSLRDAEHSLSEENVQKWLITRHDIRAWFSRWLSSSTRKASVRGGFCSAVAFVIETAFVASKVVQLRTYLTVRNSRLHFLPETSSCSPAPLPRGRTSRAAAAAAVVKLRLTSARALPPSLKVFPAPRSGNICFSDLRSPPYV